MILSTFLDSDAEKVAYFTFISDLKLMIICIVSYSYKFISCSIASLSRPAMIVSFTYTTQIISFFINSHVSCVEGVNLPSINPALSMSKEALGFCLSPYKLFHGRNILSNLSLLLIAFGGSTYTSSIFSTCEKSFA